VPQHDQVIILFAAVQGYLDDLPTEDLHAFELGLRQFMAERYPEIVRRIARTRQLPEELRQVRLPAAIAEYKEQFRAGRYRDATEETVAEVERKADLE
jgi:F-type H+-transporting ATPase subunit alpha